MQHIPLSSKTLDPRAVIEKVTLKKIVDCVPEAAAFMKKISFDSDDSGLHLNIKLLPPDIAQKIEALFQ